MSTFEAWPKTPRWNREVIITEKIDGTNSAIIIEELTDESETSPYLLWTSYTAPGPELGVFAQSRNRLITPGKTTDNYGFAAWVQENAAELVKLLGPGRHFGEWYGKGIARGYGLDHKRFALFNVKRWGGLEEWNSFHNPYQIHPSLPVDVVPMLAICDNPGALYESIPGTPEGSHRSATFTALDKLRKYGSIVAPGFDRPEGVVLYHTASGQVYKILLENDELPKGRTA